MPDGSIDPKSRKSVEEPAAETAVDVDGTGRRGISDAAFIHLLDVGHEECGDAILCQLGNVSVLIDGAHPANYRERGEHRSIQDQVATHLKQSGQRPLRVDLLVVTHTHKDHVGCLPHLVKAGELEAKWALVADPGFGWGRAASDARPALDPKARELVAALREERPGTRISDDALREFIADAATLEDRYVEMLELLSKGGCKVVRHGRNSAKPLIAALARQGVTLKILGPRTDDLLVAADILAKTTDGLGAHFEAIFRADAGVDVLTAYRRLSAAADAPDFQRAGNFVNLQSLVTVFEYRGKRFLFTGDMQLADPQTTNDTLVEGLRCLLDAIAGNAPYAFAKLPHHGSWNGFSESVLARMQPAACLGICAGTGSTHHPASETLAILRGHKDEVRWARTDKNGETTFDFRPSEPIVTKARGRINDATPNGIDEPSVAPSGTVPTPAFLPAVSQKAISTPSAVGGATTTEVGPGSDFVEVIARVPHMATRVTITIDVEPPGGAYSARSRTPPVVRGSSIALGGGPVLSGLIFVTDRATLERNIGRGETADVLRALRAANVGMIEEIPEGSDAQAVAARVRGLAIGGGPAGVVLLGGYDVVPSQRVDCLPRSLRQRLSEHADHDDFIVWSDDVYGDTDGDGIPEVPVSRIPDGKSAELVMAAIQAKHAPRAASRCGVRNIARPFAESVFHAIPGEADLHVSRPTVYNDPREPPKLDGDRVYLMLHGSDADGSRFWGEGARHEAVNLSNVPRRTGAVVFTGCCWGALTVDTPAARVVPGRSIASRTPGSSIALGFLASGAVAYVGCTGSHYSPTVPPFNFFGQPMHANFWRHYNQGKSPAQALLHAKHDYARDIPHGRQDAEELAIELKILRQYTCLGLGW